MNRLEVLELIKRNFNDCFQDDIMCTGYEWGNNLPWGIRNPLFNDRAQQFSESIKNLGLSFSTCHHAHGIGNNNEYTIVVRNTDEDGFIIEKQICKYVYVYGIYCHLVTARLEELDGRVIISRGRI